jgi:hypothetical protein
MGGMGLLKILVGVDVTIGPLLTLIIFDTRKKSLRFDLSVIAFLQIVALAYGVYIMFEARPVYTAFVKDRFEVVPADQLDAVDLAEGPAEYRMLSSRAANGGRPLPGPVDTEEWKSLCWRRRRQGHPELPEVLHSLCRCESTGAREVAAARRAAQGPSGREDTVRAAVTA